MTSDFRGRWRSLVSWPSSETIARWLDDTSWWTTPEARHRPRMLLAELLEAMAGRFAGRRLKFEVRGRTLRMTLDGVRIDPGEADPPAVGDGAAPTDHLSDAPEQVVVDASEVVIDDEHLGSVSATVAQPRIELGNVTEVVTGAIDLAVSTTRTAVVHYLRQSMPDWRMDPRDGDLVAIRPPNGHVTALVRPEIAGRLTVRAHIVGLVLFRRDFSIPRPFRRVRTFEIPWTETDLELVDAVVDGDDVKVTLRHAGIRHPIRLEDLRTAVRDGVLSL
jgi:hypothetical protein